MKKYVLWCVAVAMVPLLVGCTPINQSQCNSTAPCGCAAGGLLPQAWAYLVGKDPPPKTNPANDAKYPIARDDSNTPAAPQKKPSNVLTRQWSRNSTTKEPPVQQEVITAGGTESSTGVVSAVVSDAKKLRGPVQVGAAVTIRADDPPTKAETCDPKATTVTLKSTHIKYGASNNHTVLVGRVQEWRKTLRLRYAAVEQDDRYGGSVELEAGIEMPPLRDGQHVRVRGVIVPAEDRVSGAHFRVNAIDVLD